MSREGCQHDWGAASYGTDVGPPAVIVRVKKCRKCGEVLIDKVFREAQP